MDKLITLEEAAKSSGLSVTDILRKACTGDIRICTDFGTSSYTTFEIEFSGTVTNLANWLKSNSFDNTGCKHLTSYSSFHEVVRSIDSLWYDGPQYNSEVVNGPYLEERMKPNGERVVYLEAKLSGVWCLSESYIRKYATLGYYPPANFTNLKPFGEVNNLNFLRLHSNYFDSECKINELFITHSDFNSLLEDVLDEDKPFNKRTHSYRSQKIAQIERHAANRERVLMAAISLHKRFPDECSKNPSRWGTLLWDRRFEYWSESEGAPLSKDEIIRLLRKAVKPPEDTKN